MSSKYGRNQVVDFRIGTVRGGFEGRGVVVGDDPGVTNRVLIKVKSWDAGRGPRHLPVGSNVSVREDQVVCRVSPTVQCPQVETDGDILFA